MSDLLVEISFGVFGSGGFGNFKKGDSDLPKWAHSSDFIFSFIINQNFRAERGDYLLFVVCSRFVVIYWTRP